MNVKIKAFSKISSVVLAGLAFFFLGLNLSFAADLEPTTGTKALSTDWSGYNNIYINDGVTVTLAAGTHDLGAANLIVNSGGTITCAAPAIASVSSVAIGTGAKTFNVAPGLSFSGGQDIYIFYDTVNKMQGKVTSYTSNNGILAVNITSVAGSGTYSSWIISTSAIYYSPGVIDIKTTGNITVNSGGVISANGKGFPEVQIIVMIPREKGLEEGIRKTATEQAAEVTAEQAAAAMPLIPSEGLPMAVVLLLRI